MIIHSVYFFFLFAEYVIFLPIIEYRFYFIFIQTKLLNKTYSDIIIFFIIFLNHGYVILKLFLTTDFAFSLMFTGLIFLMCLYVIFRKNKQGIAYIYLFQIGVNLGVFVTILALIYTDYIIKPRFDLSLFVKNNCFDFTLIDFLKDDEEI